MALLNIDTNYPPYDISIDTGEFLKACFGEPLTIWPTELEEDDDSREALCFISEREEGVKYIVGKSHFTENFDNDLDSDISFRLLYPESVEGDPYYAYDVYVLVEYRSDSHLYKTHKIADSGFFTQSTGFEITYPDGSTHEDSDEFDAGYSSSPAHDLECKMGCFVWSEKYNGWLALYGDEIVVVRPAEPYLEDCSAA